VPENALYWTQILRFPGLQWNVLSTDSSVSGQHHIGVAKRVRVLSQLLGAMVHGDTQHALLDMSGYRSQYSLSWFSFKGTNPP
jgi:hypothetical protein